MSLTNLLKNEKECSKLFKCIPNVSEICKTLGYHPIAFPSYLYPLTQRIQGADPAIVGTAYDYCFRSFIQKINKNLIEKQLSPVIKDSLSNLKNDNIFKNNILSNMKIEVNHIWEKRIQYIENKINNDKELIKDSLILANFEQYYRSGYLRKEGLLYVADNDLEDLYVLYQKLYQISNLFTTNTKKIFLNPTFGNYSTHVGGADADFVIGNTLFDIKTTTYYKYKEEYIQQLIGYYLLSSYDKTFPVTITKLAIFYARFNKIIYFDIADLEKSFNLKLFSKLFHELIFQYKNTRKLKLSDSEFKKLFL